MKSVNDFRIGDRVIHIPLDLSGVVVDHHLQFVFVKFDVYSPPSDPVNKVMIAGRIGHTPAKNSWVKTNERVGCCPDDLEYDFGES